VQPSPIPVHVGHQAPREWDDIEARQRAYGEEASPWLLEQRRPAIAASELNWFDAGFEPRWLRSDTSDCAAALQPSVDSGQGAAELARFRQGVKSRNELALVIDLIGRLDDESRTTHNVFGPPSSTVFTGDDDTLISGTLLGKEARVRPAADLGAADAQLALLLVTANPAPRWRGLSLVGSAVSPRDNRQEECSARGVLVPIVETELGEPVVAAWVSPDGLERRYVVPVETPWPLLLTWLMEQALPVFVPGALRRARRQLAADVFLMTVAERMARDALADLEEDYIVRRRELTEQLDSAVTAASPIREGLLFGSGHQLEDVVRSVLESAGIVVLNLDETLGGTKNADLLCSYAGRARLVEVKSAGGSAPERAYDDLVRHLREWPGLADSVPVDGGTLVVNHERRKLASERRRAPFARPEFLTAQTELVVTTLDLFDAWRHEDAATIRRLVFGPSTDGSDEAEELEAPPPPRPQTVADRGVRLWLARRYEKLCVLLRRRPESR